MNKRNYDIPDSMATEIIAEAVRLYAKDNQSYSFFDLEQACLESQIPQHIIDKAVLNIKQKKLQEQIRKEDLQAYIKQQIKKGLAIGTALLFPTIAVFSIFIFRKQLEPISSKFVSQFKKFDSIKNITVEKGKLAYIDNPKGLSIAVYKTYLNQVSGTIGTDGYKSLNINNTECKTIELNEGIDSYNYRYCRDGGKLGQFYEYKGKYDYRVKIIEVNHDNVKFQIEKQGEEFQSVEKRLKQEIEQLQKQRNELKGKIEEIENAKDNKIRDIKFKNDMNREEIKRLKLKIQQKDEYIKEKDIKIIELENKRY